MEESCNVRLVLPTMVLSFFIEASKSLALTAPYRTKGNVYDFFINCSEEVIAFPHLYSQDFGKTQNAFLILLKD